MGCQGWSDSSAEKASVATCFYEGTHSSPDNVFDAAWHFFGISGSSPTPSPSPSPTPGGCPNTCSGYTCDEWYDYNGNTCSYEEQNFGCDCGGCQCKGDSPSPSPTPYPSPTPSPSPSPTPGGCPNTCSGYTCDEWYDYNGN